MRTSETHPLIIDGSGPPRLEIKAHSVSIIPPYNFEIETLCNTGPSGFMGLIVGGGCKSLIIRCLNDRKEIELQDVTFTKGEWYQGYVQLSGVAKHRIDTLLDDEPIHAWFGLSYAQYLTIPRSVLQSMPSGWQERFVNCLEELDKTIDWRPKNGQYRVGIFTRDEYEWDRQLHDPLMDYQRGRRRVPRRVA